MTTITDVLASYYSTNPITQLIQNARLYGDFQVGATTDKTLNGIFRDLTKYGATSFSPDEVIETVFKLLNIDDSGDDLLNYMNMINQTPFDGAKLYDYLYPTLDISRFTQSVHYTETGSIIKSNGVPVPMGDWPRFDDTYNYLIPDDMVDEIFQKCPSDKYKYTLEGRDCDDFSRIVRGGTSTLGIGNMMLGVVSAAMMTNGVSTGNHSFLFLINESKELGFADGQNDTIRGKSGDPVTWPGCDEIEIYDMVI